MDEDEDFWQQEQLELEPEYNILERVGYARTEAEEKILDLFGFTQNVRGSIITDPTHRFYIYVNASANKLISEGYIPWISFSDIGTIIDNIKNFKNVKYKNPDAFVLGYAVASGNRIDPGKFTSLIPKLKTLEPPMKPTDLLRYATLWAGKI